MKKYILVLFMFPIICFSQIKGTDVEQATEIANDIVNAIAGIDPAAEFSTITSYLLSNNVQLICPTTLSEFKKYNNQYLCFHPNLRSIGIWYIYEGKPYRNFILLDENCIECKKNGTFTYRELELKAKEKDFYSNKLIALSSYLAKLIMNKEYINWVKTN